MDDVAAAIDVARDHVVAVGAVASVVVAVATKAAVDDLAALDCPDYRDKIGNVFSRTLIEVSRAVPGVEDKDSSFFNASWRRDCWIVLSEVKPFERAFARSRRRRTLISKTLSQFTRMIRSDLILSSARNGSCAISFDNAVDFGELAANFNKGAVGTAVATTTASATTTVLASDSNSIQAHHQLRS